MRYKSFDPKLFKLNRSRFLNLMEKNSFLAILGTSFVQRNSDCNYQLRQNSDFFYLTGIDQEKSAIVIDKPSRGEPRITLYLLKSNRDLVIWEGHKLTLKDGQKISGVSDVRYIDDFESDIEKIAAKRQLCYFVEEGNPRADKSIISPHYQRNEKLKRKLKSSFKSLRFFTTKAIFSELRLIKSEEEIKAIKEACAITAKAFDEVLAHTKTGLMEYQVEGLITQKFIEQGASGHAYDPIVAGGKNACVLHYTQNDDELKSGDLLLLDFGAEYGNYAADLSRTIPVSGKFSKRQKEVYQSVLNVFKLARDLMVPGNNIQEVQLKVVKAMEVELVSLGLLTSGDLASKPDSPAYRKYFMHGIGHFLGLDVHDVGDRKKKFEKGMVLTCEPGIYIEEEGVGIRIENDILITKDGNEDLMKNIPIEIDEIESKMS